IDRSGRRSLLDFLSSALYGVERRPQVFGHRAQVWMHLGESTIDFAKRLHCKCRIRCPAIPLGHAVHTLPHLFFGQERLRDLAVQQSEPQVGALLAIRAVEITNTGADVFWRIISPQPEPRRYGRYIAD